MGPHEWKRVEELFHAALERAPAEREAFLAEACGGNEALRREVESLLAEERSAERMLEQPLAGASTQKVAVTRGTRLGPYEIVDHRPAGLEAREGVAAPRDEAGGSRDALEPVKASLRPRRRTPS